MAKDTGCTTRQEWCDLVKNEERLPTESKQRMEQEQEHLYGDEVHSSQGKRQWEETLERLALVLTEYSYMLQNMMTYVQEIDNELSLVLALIRTDLEKSGTESLFSEETNEKGETEQKIIANLTELVEGQEEIKSKLSDQSQIEDLTKIVETMALKQNDQERKPFFKCYWCHEEGHMKRNCPQRINKRWMESQVFKQYPQRINRGWQSQPFKQSIASRYKHNVDEMHEGISMSWPVERRNDTEVINIGQSRKENTTVSYNPLN